MSTGEIIGIVSINLAAAVLIADRVLKPKRERRIAEAQERPAMARASPRPRALTGVPSPRVAS